MENKDWSIIDEIIDENDEHTKSRKINTSIIEDKVVEKSNRGSKQDTFEKTVFEMYKERTVEISPKKQWKLLRVENIRIKKILKKILKHIKYLDKQIFAFKKFGNKNKQICRKINTLVDNFEETLMNLKDERDFLEQKHLDNKILIDKLLDTIKNK